MDDEIRGKIERFLLSEKIREIKKRGEYFRLRFAYFDIMEKQRELEERYNHNHDSKGRFTFSSGGSSKPGLTSGGGSGRINDNKFHTLHDPMFEVTGAAEISHPEEIKALEEHIASLGATLVRPDTEELNYQPGLTSGEAGRVVISKNASYSAWLHEVKHLDDDYADGYLGMRVFANPQKCIQREKDAYEIEIQLAKKAGRNDIVKRLETLRDEEIAHYK